MNTNWLVMRDVSEPVKTTLNPLHRTSNVLPSGLATVVTACPASQDGLAVRSGFIGPKREPGGASGVICWPILGRSCESGLVVACAWAKVLDRQNPIVKLAAARGSRCCTFLVICRRLRINRVPEGSRSSLDYSSFS